MDVDGTAITHDPATQIAVQELEREGIDPHNSPGLTLSLRFVTGLYVGLCIGDLISPESAIPRFAPATAWMILGASAAGFGLAGVAGRRWAQSRLRRRSGWISNSPNRSPGLWYERPRRRAIGFSILLAILLFALSRSATPNHTRGRRSSRLDRPDLTPEQSVVIGDTIFGISAGIVGVVAARSWIDHRRFGASRLVTDRTDVLGGQTISAALEATERLARAREVRFDLVETDRAYSDIWKHGLHVRATATVPVTAFQMVHGLTLVSMSLPVPPDARPSAAEDKHGVHFYLGVRYKEQRWEIRASADVDGLPYRARFPLKVVSATPPEPELPYTPQPIIIPPSDKLPQSKPPST